MGVTLSFKMENEALKDRSKAMINPTSIFQVLYNSKILVMENHSATTRAADHAWYRRACRSLSRSARRGSSCARLRLKVGVKTIPFLQKSGL